VVDRNRQKVIADLAKAKDAIAKDQKAIADFGDEARRAAVPPGWLP
jgi:parvulin-like peptidyl-prolyl isomerase